MWQGTNNSSSQGQKEQMDFCHAGPSKQTTPATGPGLPSCILSIAYSHDWRKGVKKSCIAVHLKINAAGQDPFLTNTSSPAKSATANCFLTFGYPSRSLVVGYAKGPIQSETSNVQYDKQSKFASLRRITGHQLISSTVISHHPGAHPYFNQMSFFHAGKSSQMAIASWIA